MGAHDISFELDGTKTVSEVIKAFKNQQSEDSTYNGHQDGYSGDFQTVSDVKIVERVFDTYDQAFEFCLSKSKKWDFVTACKYKVVNQLKETKTEANLIAKAKQADNDLREFERAIDAELTKKLDSTKFITCAGCKSKINTTCLKSNRFSSHRCPACQATFYTKTQLTKIAKLKEKSNVAWEKHRKYKDTLIAKAAAKSKKTNWLVAGWGAC